tara:strand:- start:3037 stop:4191 length:1155 start_codon:yes stop_codon:yes gene_type:complete
MYTPKTKEEQNQMIVEVAQATNSNPNEVFLKYVSFGALFAGDIARTAAMTYVRQGKACLTADGMFSLVIQSGKMAWFRYIEQSAERCIMEVKRADFPEDLPPQQFEYSMEDAHRAGTAGSMTYKKLPARMLTARCKTNLCRDYFSDVVAGYYSVDEIMDNQNMDDRERAIITAQSLGEDINLSSPPAQKKRVSQPPNPNPSLWTDEPEQRHLEIEFEQPARLKSNDAREAPYTHRAAPTPLIDFADCSDIQAACEFNFIPLEEVNAVAQRLQIHMDRLNGEECKRFFYTWCLSGTLRNTPLQDNWWRNISESAYVFTALYQEFAALEGVTEREIGQMMGNGDFWEAVKVSAHFSGQRLEEARRIVKDLARGKVDPSACAYLTSL